MPDQWTIQGKEYANCNCDWGCPCQFGAPSTHGSCAGLVAGEIESGFFNQTPLDGLSWVMVARWPGEISEGNGRQQFIIDERANPAQREALFRILSGESGTQGATPFSIFASTMSEICDPIFAAIDLSIDIEARRARVQVPGLLESEGNPIIHPVTGEETRAGIHLPNGFEYTYAEMGSGTSRIGMGIDLDLTGSYAQFNRMHLSQDGIVR